MFDIEASRLQETGSIKEIHNNSGKETVFGLRADLIICLFLVLITLTCYWQIINHDFINYDDDVYVTENHNVQNGLTLKNIVWAFSAEVSGNWHPLTLLSHMLDCHLFGLNAGLHHLTSLFLHIANTLLLFIVLRRMTAALWQSAFVAALFALHPLHIESVAWVAERKDVLSTLFWMLTMIAYERYARHQSLSRYMLIIFFFALGLMAKPMLVTLPFVLFLLDYWPLKRFQFGRMSGTRSLILEKIPFLALSAASSTITWIIQQSWGAVGSLSAYHLSHRIANSLLSYSCYIEKMFWPNRLAVFYPYSHTFPLWQMAGVCLLLASFTFLSMYFVKRHPFLAVGWLWYIGTLVPVIGLVQVGVQAMADRYTYIPLIGLFIIISWGLPELLSQWRHKKTVLTILASVFVLVLTTISWLQVRNWVNSRTLFEHTVGITTNNFVAHKLWGEALASNGMHEEAYAQFFKALRINPRYADGYNSLGIALGRQGSMTEAIRYFLLALRINPGLAEAHSNLGVALMRLGKIDLAITHFEAALRIRPQLLQVRANLDTALAQKTNKDNLKAAEHNGS